MSPDDPRPARRRSRARGAELPIVPPRRPPAVPDEAVVAGLEAELADAGARARATVVAAESPTPLFASALRDRLLARYPMPATDGSTALDVLPLVADRMDAVPATEERLGTLRTVDDRMAALPAVDDRLEARPAVEDRMRSLPPADDRMAASPAAAGRMDALDAAAAYRMSTLRAVVDRMGTSRARTADRMDAAGEPTTDRLDEIRAASADRMDAIRAASANRMDALNALRAAPSRRRVWLRAVRARLRPRLHWPRPSLFAPSRWAVATVTVALVVVGLFAAGSTLLQPRPPVLRATEAVAATLTRQGVTSPLEVGTPLQSGDTIATGAEGTATLALGGSLARLSPGASIRIHAAGADAIELDQLAGRAYHRVNIGGGARYVVTFDVLSVTASGTAFDVTAPADSGAPRVVRILALEHDVTLLAPGLNAVLTEGLSATVWLEPEPGTAGPEETGLDVESLSVSDLEDGWLASNARLDAEAGFPLGQLTGISTSTPAPTAKRPGPTPSGTTRATPRPTASQRPSPKATPRPTTRATPKPTARPTPNATPRPTPTSTPRPSVTPRPSATPLPTLGLGLTSCGGGLVIVDWAKYAGDVFSHYATLRSTSSSIPPAYPPQEGATYLEHTRSSDRATTQALDVVPSPGSAYFYRSMAFGGGDRVLAASAVTRVQTRTTRYLGALAATFDEANRTVTFSWTPYLGRAGCFETYKLVYSTDGSSPSYLKGSPYLFAGGEQAQGTFTSDPLDPGTYRFRLQAIRTVDWYGKVAVAQTGVAEVVVP